jgi:hypothetical protein
MVAHMIAYHWNITLSDTETIALERALWLLINQDFPGKDAALEDAARAILQRLPLNPVLAQDPNDTRSAGC